MRPVSQAWHGTCVIERPVSDLTRQDRADGQATILVVDDEKGPRESLRMILRPTYEVLCARDGLEALEILRTEAIDLVTLDLNMPGIQGEEMMRTIRREFPNVELIVITGYGTLENAAEAVRYGVSDYLQKPFDVVQVSASVFRALSRRRGRSRLVDFLETLGAVVGLDNQVAEILEHVERDPRVNRRVAELFAETGQRAERQQQKSERVRTMGFLEVLADTVESHCEFMRGHARRTAFYAGLLADRLCLSARDREQIRLSGFLHDIGKIGVPTDLLMRPGALTTKERRVIERHPEIGARLVEPLGIDTEISAVIRHHHEWWDGRGYPDGLYGEQIPAGRSHRRDGGCLRRHEQHSALPPGPFPGGVARGVQAGCRGPVRPRPGQGIPPGARFGRPDLSHPRRRGLRTRGSGNSLIRRTCCRTGQQRSASMSAAEIQRPLFGSDAAPSSVGAGTRREPREELVRHVEYCPFPRARPDQCLRVGFTRDLSPSGMCVRVDTPERVGSLLRVILREVDGRRRLESIARIAWSSPTVDGGHWIGLALLEPGRRHPIPVRREPRAARPVEVA